jgi:DNA-directed RNA polymerase subunit L
MSMLAEITDVKDNEIQLKIREEDISILYIIQHELLKEKSTDFAGIVQKHPLTKEYHMGIVTKRKDPMEVIQDASTSAQEYSKELLSMIKSAIKK